MADFATIFRKTIGALEENTTEARARVYEKARTTIDSKLAAISPPPPQHVIDQQRQRLEDAIAEVEAEYTASAAPALNETVSTEESAPADETVTDEAEQPEQDTGPADDVDESAQQPAALETGDTPEESGEPEPESVAAAAGLSAFPDEGTNADRADPDLSWQDEFPTADDTSFGSNHGFSEDSGGDTDGLSQVPPDEEIFLTQNTAGDPADLAGPEAEHEGAAPLPGPDLHADTGRRRNTGGKILLLLLIAVLLGGVGYGAWHFRDSVTQLAGLQGSEEETAAANGEADGAPQQQAGNDEQGAQSASNDSSSGEEKFTQRLLADGREVDSGPAGGEPGIGEGTSVAQATTSGSEAGDQGSGQTDTSNQALPVGQQAIFYEERTNVAQASADSGAVVWSIVEESPGANLPPEPAIRAEATIPEKGLQLKLTIRRNVDQSLPASHIMELIFLTPENFDGGGIDNVLRVSMKRTEQDTGRPLAGIPAKIGDGFFLMALSDDPQDLQINTALMRQQNWLDVPVVYTSGRRALVTLEKGVPGERIFNEALQAWEAASSG